MGMFDIFMGEVKCPYCGEIHEVEEQTKRYSCLLEEFHIGDYVDKYNANYIYTFEAYCDYDYYNKFDVGIVINKGQIIKFLVNEEIENYKNKDFYEEHQLVRVDLTMEEIERLKDDYVIQTHLPWLQIGRILDF